MDLDKHIFSLEISNETKQVSFSKRLFFNKSQLPIGFIDVRQGEIIKFSFNVAKSSSDSGSSRPDVISEFRYEATEQGLKGISDNCVNEVIELFSW